MNCKIPLALTIFFLPGLMATSVTADPREIILPSDTSTLRVSDLPGYAVAQQKCGICHSADYISYQPPGMNQEQWTAEMKKMQHSYGAPISDDEVKSIGAYLAVAYGSAQATDDSIIAASAASNAPALVDPNAEIDVKALLDANACLGCHAIDTKIVGPAFHDIAARYSSDDKATATLAESIQNGGAGKWGEMPMPPMAKLTDAQARALATYVLEK